MSHTTFEPVTSRLHRSELAAPGSNPKMIEKASRSAADVVFLDLEDSVAPDDKPQARKKLGDYVYTERSDLSEVESDVVTEEYIENLEGIEHPILLTHACELDHVAYRCRELASECLVAPPNL